MDRLSEQQERFESFAKGNFYYHEPPILSLEVQTALKRLGLDDCYRFIWGGVAVIRDDMNNPKPIAVRGDRNACYEYEGWLMPKYLFQRVAQPIGWAYKTEDGHTVHAVREEQIPAWVWAQQIVRREYRYIEYGNLRWYIEQKAADNVDPRATIDGWFTITPPIEDEDGKYYEPDLRLVHMLQEREWENQNADLRKVMARDMAAREMVRVAREAKKEKEADQLWTEAYADIIDHEAKKDHGASVTEELKKMSDIVRGEADL